MKHIYFGPQLLQVCVYVCTDIQYKYSVSMCVYCICLVTVRHVRFDIWNSQLKGMCEVL